MQLWRYTQQIDQRFFLYRPSPGSAPTERIKKGIQPISCRGNHIKVQSKRTPWLILPRPTENGRPHKRSLAAERTRTRASTSPHESLQRSISEQNLAAGKWSIDSHPYLRRTRVCRSNRQTEINSIRFEGANCPENPLDKNWEVEWARIPTEDKSDH